MKLFVATLFFITVASLLGFGSLFIFTYPNMAAAIFIGLVGSLFVIMLFSMCYGLADSLLNSLK